MRGVVAVMAELAHRSEIALGAVLRRVIEVRDREHDARASDRVRLAVDGSAACVLAPAAHPVVADATADGCPVLRVALPVLGTERRQLALP
jgi:hypothetical protein